MDRQDWARFVFIFVGAIGGIALAGFLYCVIAGVPLFRGESEAVQVEPAKPAPKKTGPAKPRLPVTAAPANPAAVNRVAGKPEPGIPSKSAAPPTPKIVTEPAPAPAEIEIVEEEPAATPEKPTKEPPPAKPTRPAKKTEEPEADKASAVVNALISALDGTRPQDRARAAMSLADLKSGALPAVDALIKAMADISPEVRLAAAHALGCIGPEAKAAIPALANNVQREQVDDIRGVSASAIVSIDPASPELRKILGQMIVGGAGVKVRPTENDVVRSNREWACKAIQHIGEDAAWAIPLIKGVLLVSASEIDERGLEPFKLAVKTITAIGPEDKSVVVLLRGYRSGRGLRASSPASLQQAIEIVDTAIRTLESGTEAPE